ncbi:glycosyltransferase family 4 protein [Nocardioides sp.]|uniref:glycosyltransferase family 4 protein n=1 Tax=Nocardioides sp. TaxID=35761 RepID=UPI002CC5227A|nr:glycosyltransferase family 4 protein [Nocardioides sp.]HXH77216.1 glycosyltransferase family 4 protein [Nocardioides sp.]
MTAKIVFAANQGDIGGGEVMLLHLATAAREFHVDVEVVAPSASPVADLLSQAGFRVHGLGSTRREYLLALPRFARATPGLLWCNGLGPALTTAGRRNRVVHLHQTPSGRHAVAARLARSRARAVVVPSRSSALHVPGARVLANWTSEVVPEPRSQGDVQPVIGFLGRPSVAKGVVVLAEAISLLARRSDPAPRLLLAGESHFVDPEEQASVGVALGRIDHLCVRQGWTSPSRFFGQVDLAVFPSIVPESFGLVAAEAMSARVPFVVSDAGALPEVAGAEHPWIARSGDADALADTIEAALCSPPGQTAHAVASARERWEAHFSPVAGHARLGALLRDLGLI